MRPSNATAIGWRTAFVRRIESLLPCVVADNMISSHRHEHQERLGNFAHPCNTASRGAVATLLPTFTLTNMKTMRASCWTKRR